MHSSAAGSGLLLVQSWETNSGTLEWAKREHGVRVIRLSSSFPHRKTSDLSQEELNRLTGSLQAVRQAGLTAVVRFSYWYHWDGTDQIRVDALPEQAHRHVDQLAPVINANRDVILAVEAGFIGKWGEWHYHGVPAQYQTYGERSLSNDPNGARAQLLRKLVSTWQVPIALRYPRDIRWAFTSLGLTAEQKARIAHHADAVLTGPGEWGTWDGGATDGETDEQWFYRVFLATPRIVMGEFGESTSYSESEMRVAYDSLARRQYSVHSWDSGNQPGGIKDMLMRMSHPRGGTYWDDLQRHLGRWP